MIKQTTTTFQIIQCPNKQCKKKLRVAKNLEMKKIRCPECNLEFIYSGQLKLEFTYSEPIKKDMTKIAQAGEKLAKRITENAKWCENSIVLSYKKLLSFSEKMSLIFKKIPITDETAIFFEFILLFLHIIERQAKKYLSEKENLKLMDSMYWGIYKTISEDENEDHFQIFCQSIKEPYYEFSDIYGKYEMNSKKSDSLKGTLIWEFSKTIADYMGFQKDLRIMMACATIIGEALKRIKIGETLNCIY